MRNRLLSLASLNSGRLGRLAALTGLAVLLATLGGDRTALAIVERGIDPLQVLDLYVRPNVIIVLDASGSMTGTVGTNNTFTGDHPRSRLFQAKSVIRDVVEAFQGSVNFQMGAYTQSGPRLRNANPVLASGHGEYRFQYVTMTEDYPSASDEQMETGELAVMGDLGRTLPDTTPCVGGQNNANASACDGKERGLQSWQIIQPGANEIVYEEGGVSCTVTITATKKFYRVGGPPAAVAGGAPAGTLAADIEAAMNGCAGRPAAANVYRVSYVADTGRFTFTRRTGANDWRLRWTLSSARGSFGYPLSNPADTAAGPGPFTPNWTPYMLLIRRPGAADPYPAVSPWPANNPSWGLHWRIVETGIDPDGAGPQPARTVTSHQLYAGAYFNGEVVRVDPNGTVCDVTFPSAPLPVPAKVTLQGVSAGCGADTGTPVDFTIGGGELYGNNSPANCSGYAEGAGLRPCDQSPGDTQLNAILPVIDREVPVEADGTLTSYSEDPATLVASLPPDTVGGARASGNTPIAASLVDIKFNFNLLWNTGQVACPAGPPSSTPYKWDVAHCPDKNGDNVSDPGYTRPALDAINTHTDPKERTIVLFVTDGDDTCAGSGDAAARAAAYRAQQLYARINAAEPASSVQTYVLGFGNGATPYRLNWIAWGGSGMVKPNTGGAWSTSPTTAEEVACKAAGLCQDAFIAPDAATLKSYIEGIINQGATSGEFVAQDPLFTSVFEYVATVSSPSTPFDPNDPETRYEGFVPVRIQSSFTLPGFKGNLKAYANDLSGATPPGTVTLWDASARLSARLDLSAGKCSATNTADRCTFRELHGGATDLNVRTSNAAIKRRIYTSGSNGVFPVTNANRVDLTWMRTQGSAGARVALWPPSTSPVAVIPTSDGDYSSAGDLDRPLGLPVGSLGTTQLNDLASRYRACQGSNLPPACADPSDAVKAAAARKEAREMILAYMAGAEWVPDANGNPTRTGNLSGNTNDYKILYKRRSDPLADATYGSVALISQPISPLPELSQDEYKLYREGGLSGGNKTVGVLQGFGLTKPDADCANASLCVLNPSLKPRMSVVLQGANDMLHAFRVGCNSPTVAGSYACSIEGGGEELWGLVPYDQLSKLGDRLAVRPPRRSPHTYMITTAVRFADVFVPGDLTPSDGSPTLSSLGIGALPGLWRQIAIFGRGEGGKYLTGLDVTSIGPYTTYALDTMPPLILWNRGNPDTRDGTLAGVKNNTLTSGDYDAYRLMGETWSAGTISYVNRLGTVRKPCADGTHGDSSSGVAQRCSDQVTGGVPFVSFLGSGYGDDGTQEGYAFYTLDTLTGDIVAYSNVETKAAAVGWNRTGGNYPGFRNAIVADPAGFAPNQYVYGPIRHPASSKVSRVYVGDLHGRAWKFLPFKPDTAIAFADLGADQPVGVAAALIQPSRGVYADLPHIYMIAGNETRADGPFKLFGLYDVNTDDTDLTDPDPATVTLFSRVLQPADAGTKTFRGTVAPKTGFTRHEFARVIFAATRFNKPADPDAPPVPPYPCRSSFDSLIYGLRADSGTGAYNLPNDGGAAEFIQGVRILTLAVVGDPTTGEGYVEPITGQVTSIPPPPAGGTAPDPLGGASVMLDNTVPGALFRNATSVCSAQ